MNSHHKSHGVKRSAQALEVLYTSDSALSTPVSFFSRALADLRLSLDPAWHLFLKNIRSQHRQSVLGYAWILLIPLATMLLWVSLNKMGILPIGRTHPPYLLYVLSGSLLWEIFTESLRCPLQDLKSAREMLTKIRLPHEAVILAGIGNVVFNFLIRYSLVIPALVYYKVEPSFGMLLVPLGGLSILILGLSVGLILAPIGLIYTDVAKALEIVLRFGFMATPIVYPIATAWPGSVLTKINPLIPLIVSTRNWMCGLQLTPFHGFFAVTGCALILLIAGWIFYRVSSPHLITRL